MLVAFQYNGKMRKGPVLESGHIWVKLVNVVVQTEGVKVKPERPYSTFNLSRIEGDVVIYNDTKPGPKVSVSDFADMLG